MTNIDDRVREYYRSQALPEDIVDAMLAQATEAQAAEPVNKLPLWRLAIEKLQIKRIQVGLAAAVLLMVAASVHNHGVHAERTDRAVKEVAMNHTNRFELDYESDSVAALDESMALLPFELSLPKHFSEQYRVEGARYCSLSGQVAAHVKLIHRSTHKPFSVFMTRAADELDVIDDSSAAVDGLNVNIWRESGLLYALVGS